MEIYSAKSASAFKLFSFFMIYEHPSFTKSSNGEIHITDVTALAKEFGMHATYLRMHLHYLRGLGLFTSVAIGKNAATMQLPMTQLQWLLTPQTKGI